MDGGGEIATAQEAETRRLRVFLSYSRKDSEFIARLAEALTARGFLADFDRSTHDKDNVETGISAEDEWWMRLQEMIAAADVMVFAVSPDSASSNVCDEEIAYARSLGKRVIAIQRRQIDFAHAPPRLAALNVKLSFADDAAFEASVAELETALNRDVAWLREQTRLVQAAADWEKSGRREEELLHGAEIGEAEAWSARRPANAPEVSELLLAFLAESRRAEGEREEKERRSLRRQRGLQRWVGGLIAVALAITIAGGWYVVQRQREVARSQSLTLARTASQMLAQDDYAGALRIAVLAGRDTFLSPASSEAEAMLAATATASPMMADLAGHEGSVSGAMFTPDGNVLSWGEDKTARLWDIHDGAAVKVIAHEGKVTGAGYFLAGDRFVTTDDAGNVRIFSAEDGSETGAPMKHERAVYSATPSPDGELLLVRVGGPNDAGAQKLVVRRTSDGSQAGEIMFGGMVRGAVFARDGRRALVWSAEGLAQVRDVETGEALIADMRHDGDIVGAEFSLDETRILTWSGGVGRSDRSARLWDAKTGAPIGGPLQHAAVLTGARFLADGGAVLTRSADGTARLWDAKTGAPIGQPMSHNQPVNPDAPPDIWAQLNQGVHDADEHEWTKRIATVGSDLRVRLWDRATAAPLQPVLTLPASSHRVAFAAGGANVVTQDDRGTVSVWSLATGQRLGAEIPTGSGMGQIVLSDDRRQMLTWSNDGRLCVWSLSAGGSAPWMAHEGIVRGASILPDGAIMSWGADKAVRFWHGEAHDRVGEPLMHDEGVVGASLSPLGDRVLTWSFDGAARVWDLKTHKLIGEPMRGGGVMLSAIWLDGERIATMSEDRIARVWDAATGGRIGPEMKHDTPEGRNFSVYQPVFYELLDFFGATQSADGERLLTWANADDARLWDAKTGALAGKPMAHGNLVNGAVFSHDGAMIATWSGQSLVFGKEDNSARLWDARTAEPIGAAMMQAGAVRGAAFSADDSRLVTWSQNGEVQLWDTASAQPVGPLMKHEDYVVGAAFSPDGKLIASWDTRGSVKFWDAATGVQAGRSLPHNGSVVSAEFHGDGRYLLTLNQTNSVRPQARVWDVSLRREVLTLGVGAGITHGVRWEGDRILTWGEGNAVQSWPADWLRPRARVGDLAEEVCARKLSASAVRRETVDGPMWVGARRITVGDVDLSPMLAGREGEDVCAWKPQWYDRVLDGVFGWMD